MSRGPDGEAPLDDRGAVVETGAQPLNRDAHLGLVVEQLPERRRHAAVATHVAMVVGQHAVRSKAEERLPDDPEASDQDEHVWREFSDVLRLLVTSRIVEQQRRHVALTHQRRGRLPFVAVPPAEERPEGHDEDIAAAALSKVARELGGGSFFGAGVNGAGDDIELRIREQCLGHPTLKGAEAPGTEQYDPNQAASR